MRMIAENHPDRHPIQLTKTIPDDSLNLGLSPAPYVRFLPLAPPTKVQICAPRLAAATNIFAFVKALSKNSILAGIGFY
jgi:hypothetical protein